MAKVGTLTDNFATADGAKWTYGTGITVASGQLNMVPDATFTRVLPSVATYDLTDSEALIEVPSMGSSQIFSFSLEPGAGDQHRVSIVNEFGNLRLREIVATVQSDVSIAYSAVDHRWWRIRHAGGTLYWETSNDGTSWTVRRSKAPGIPAITALTVRMLAYTASGTTPTLVDNFNLGVAAPAGTGSWWIAASHLWAPQSAAPTGGGGGPFTMAYYVSPSGNDSNVGTDPGAPWLTVNRAVQNEWVAGAALLFERGGTYQINAINKTPTPAGGARFTIGSYGSGALPIMSHWKICNNPASWSLFSTGIWRIQLGLASTHTGMTEVPARVAFARESNTNIGFISTDGVIRGAKKTSIAACTAQWDFFGDTTGDWFYVRSSANPMSLVSDFRAAPDGRLIQMQPNMEIVDLEFQGCGGIVFSGASSTPNNVKMLRNTIRNVGGSYLIGYGNPPYQTRWGDAVEIMGGASNIEFAYNTIIGSFDPAIVAAQLAGNISDIWIHHNNISFSCCALELSIKNGNWNNIIMEDNTGTDIGLGGWASPLQPNQDRNSCIICMDMDPAHGASTNIVFRRNYFERASRYLFTFPIYDPPLPAGCTFTNNDIRLASGREMQFTKETINNAAAYQSRTGREAGSTFTVL